MRRASEGLVEGLPSSYRLAPPTIFPMDMTLHREKVMKERMVPIGKDGSLRLSAEYCSDNQRLRVRLISAEGLYPHSVDPKVINCSISLSLVPGKLQKAAQHGDQEEPQPHLQRGLLLRRRLRGGRRLSGIHRTRRNVSFLTKRLLADRPLRTCSRIPPKSSTASEAIVRSVDSAVKYPPIKDNYVGFPTLLQH
ncbi:hypothetical protein fugu_011731 [Takifugu bimaculatus]|uniref:Uncharacterized protein n=1 Tax=Takifugu bimaculatus TaxID=433685 RepID=A0A4Z2C8C1_9TELE|nr:hypothetical protein fugu_011731 [Takifugu bimaculatus]